MPRQNRVNPLSELIADPARGLVYGNRGCLHDDRGEIRRRFATRRWIACRLEFKGWRRKALLQPGRFTELFFLDEATALAAGHRPCFFCRRAAAKAFPSWSTTSVQERSAVFARLARLTEARSEEITLRKWFRRPRWSRIKETVADLLKPQL